MILNAFGQITKFGSCVHFQSAPHGHEIPARGISLQKPSVHDWGRPQCQGKRWRRLRITPTIASNIDDFAIFPDVTVWGESMVERGFVRKVAPGGAIISHHFAISQFVALEWSVSWLDWACSVETWEPTSPAVSAHRLLNRRKNTVHSNKLPRTLPDFELYHEN